jgi:hypothetical protein
MTVKPCYDRNTCIRREVSSLLDPDSPIVDRIYVAACAVAMTCGERSAEEIHVCAARMFDVTPQSELAKAFVFVHKSERDARDGRMQTERQLAAEFRGASG